MWKRLVSGAVIIACVSMITPTAIALDMYWCGGNWNTTTANWTPDGSTFVPWNNASYDTAVIGSPGASGTITVAGSTSIVAGGIKLTQSGCNIDAYSQSGASITFDSGSTDPATLSILWSTSGGGGPWFDGNLNIPDSKTLDIVGTVVSESDYSSLFIWNDTGTPNSYTGTLTIDDGVVVPVGTAILPTTSAGTIVKDGGTLELIYQGSYTSAPLTLNGMGVGGSRGALSFWSANDPGDIYWNSSIILDSDSAIRATPYYGGEKGIITGAISESAGGSKSLGVIGTGILVLANVNSYTGNTVVINTTLALTGAGSIATSPIIALQTGATLDVTTVTGGFTLAGTQTLMGNGNVVGNVVAAAGSHVAPGESVGTLNVVGDLDLLGTLDVEYDSGTNTIDQLLVSGDLDLSGGTLDFSSITGLTDPAYVFATYGTLSGSLPSENGVPVGYLVDYAYQGSQIALVVPEPSTLVLLICGAIGLLLRRR
ncbi:MAG: PEP-CTERM sorting domain-containing protein [Pirellulales bacterium]|nr:PEP-CTERM sorting domain-containing protein [Pirellulales bacterium]